MKPSFILSAILLFLVGFSGFGCAAIEARQRMKMTPLEQLDRAYKKQGNQTEKRLNEYFAQARNQFDSMPTDVGGLKASYDISATIDNDIESIRVFRRNKKYTWPELREFAQQFRALRDRQLETLRPVLTDDSEKLSSQARGYEYLIHTGPLADTNNPIFAAAVAAQWRSWERQAKAAQQRRIEEIARVNRELGTAIVSFGALLATVQAAREIESKGLMEKGVCPNCRGTKKIPVGSKNDCASCRGSGLDLKNNQVVLCDICAGLGHLGRSSELVDCKPCRGSGKYPRPD